MHAEYQESAFVDGADLKPMTPVRTLAGSLDALDTAGHRVSNSLATVSSLLALQELRAQSGAVREALETARARVHAISNVHRHIVFDGKAEYAWAPELIEAVIENALQAQGKRDRVSVSAGVQPLKLSARDANAIGLAVHELVTNALQHGFAGVLSGTVTVSLLQDEAGVPVLEVRDNGTGGVDPSFAPTALVPP